MPKSWNRKVRLYLEEGRKNLSKLIKSASLTGHTIIKPNFQSNQESFEPVATDGTEKCDKKSETTDFKKQLEESIKLGYEEGYKRGYEEGYEIAKREGYEVGYKEGMREAERQLEEEKTKIRRQHESEINALLSNFRNFMTRLEKEFSDVILDLDDQILRIALDIARVLVLREVEADRELLIRIIREALNYISEGASITVRVNPEDVDFLQRRPEFFSMNYKIKIISDMSISRGGMVIESSLGVIDATFEKRWEIILKELVGEPIKLQKYVTDLDHHEV
ncbi:MAG: FliH/SctL family protein [Candidatus Kryptonium sp.]